MCVCIKQINFMFILESYSKDTRIPHHVFASTPKSEKIQNPKYCGTKHFT